VPGEIASELLVRLEGASVKETDYAAAVARGDFSNDWVDALLGQNGLILDGSDAARS
jgi:hypothetical protein